MWKNGDADVANANVSSRVASIRMQTLLLYFFSVVRIAFNSMQTTRVVSFLVLLFFFIILFCTSREFFVFQSRHFPFLFSFIANVCCFFISLSLACSMRTSTERGKCLTVATLHGFWTDFWCSFHYHRRELPFLPHPLIRDFVIDEDFSLHHHCLFSFPLCVCVGENVVFPLHSFCLHCARFSI